MGAMVFFNIGWMNRYEGPVGDAIQGGGAWVATHGVGHEVHNFAPYRGRYYGFVRSTNGRPVGIDRLGAKPANEFVDGVTVAWVAKHPAGGLRLVGWYQNARVYRNWQNPPAGAQRPVRSKRDQAGYYTTARRVDSVCLDAEDRTLLIPRNRRGGMGQSNVWFAESRLGRATIARVKSMIRTHLTRVRATPPKTGRSALPRLVDAERRARIEHAAVHAVRLHYESKGFRIRDVQSDNIGWDLEASRGRERLLLEVKGLSGAGTMVELTPNEYMQMRAHRDQFRLCVVSHALTARSLSMRRFAFHPGAKAWVDQHDQMLQVEERTGARARFRHGVSSAG